MTNGESSWERWGSPTAAGPGARIVVRTPPQNEYELHADQPAAHGWRLTVQYEPNGRRVAHWRCPKCWDRHRKATRR